MTKVLSNHLATVFYLPVDNAQSASIKGYSIIEYFLSAHKILVYYRRFGLKGIMYKLDFEKAFDIIKLDFLLSLLIAQDFFCK